MTQRDRDHDGSQTGARAPVEWLSPSDIATELGVSVRTVRRWCESGELPASKAGPKFWRVRRDDLAAYLARAR